MSVRQCPRIALWSLIELLRILPIAGTNLDRQSQGDARVCGSVRRFPPALCNRTEKTDVECVCRDAISGKLPGILLRPPVCIRSRLDQTKTEERRWDDRADVPRAQKCRKVGLWQHAARAARHRRHRVRHHWTANPANRIKRQ